MTETTIELTASAFASLVRPVLPFAGRDQMLPLLMQVQFAVRGDVLTATTSDRFRAGICRHDLATAPGDVTFGLTTAAIAQILLVFRGTKAHDPELRIIVETAGITPFVTVEQGGGLTFASASLAFRSPEGAFPNIEKLLHDALNDTNTPSADVMLNGTFLADFKHVTRNREPLIVRHGASNKAVLVIAGDHFLGLIMPVRDHDGVGSRATTAWNELVGPAASKAVSGMSAVTPDHVLVTRVVKAFANGDVMVATAAGDPLLIPADVLTAAVAARNVDQTEHLRSIARHPSVGYARLRLIEGDCS